MSNEHVLGLRLSNSAHFWNIFFYELRTFVAKFWCWDFGTFFWFFLWLKSKADSATFFAFRIYAQSGLQRGVLNLYLNCYCNIPKVESWLLLAARLEKICQAAVKLKKEEVKIKIMRWKCSQWDDDDATDEKIAVLSMYTMMMMLNYSWWWWWWWWRQMKQTFWE